MKYFLGFFSVSSTVVKLSINRLSYYEYSFSCLSNKVALIQPELGSGRGEEPFEERNALSFDLPGSNGDPPKVADLSHL